MDRTLYPKHYPTISPSVPPSDNYMKTYMPDLPGGIPRPYDPYPPLNTGITRPIYDVFGNVQFSLPLDQYPPRDGYHPQVRGMNHNPYGWGRC